MMRTELLALGMLLLALPSHAQDPIPPKESLEGAANIAEVVSEVRECLPGLPTPQTLDPEQARFRLHDSITTFLTNASLR